jgi:hypothetical protein
MTQTIRDYAVFSSLSRCHPSSQACHHAKAFSIVASAYIFISRLLAYHLAKVFLLRGPSVEKKAPNKYLVHEVNEEDRCIG